VEPKAETVPSYHSLLGMFFVIINASLKQGFDTAKESKNSPTLHLGRLSLLAFVDLRLLGDFFAMEQSPGKKAIFLSESQFFKVRSDGYVAAALDCDKSHQTALTPSSMTSPMSPMSKCSRESIP